MNDLDRHTGSGLPLCMKPLYVYRACVQAYKQSSCGITVHAYRSFSRNFRPFLGQIADRLRYCRVSHQPRATAAQSASCPFLPQRDYSPEGGQPSARANHDDGLGGILRQPEVRVLVYVHWNSVAHLISADWFSQWCSSEAVRTKALHKCQSIPARPTASRVLMSATADWL